MALPAERQRFSDDEWNRLEAPITAFEAAWMRGDRPTIADYLPSDSPHRLLLLIELVHAELEFRLKAGGPARVETYLVAFPELEIKPEVVLGLIRAEWAIRSRRERDLDLDHYLIRFPGLAAELASNPGGPLPVARLGQSTAQLQPGGFTDGPLPKMFGKYELRQKVGTGSFGFVYRAWDPVLARDVAIKVPRPEVAASPIDIANFLREARNTINLRHSNIVEIRDAGPVDGTNCLVSDFIEGMTLTERLRTGPVAVPEAIRLMRQILEALEHAHRQGIVHRDLKPSNILLDHNDKPHLTDFGLARRSSGDSTLSPVGAAQVIIGTPAYMAPEQARGDTASVDRRSDLYSAGVLFYEMLTGTVPFRGRGRLLQLQIEEATPLPPSELNNEITPNLELIVLRALAKDPADRYQTAEAMAAELENYATGKPISSRPSVKPSTFWQQWRRAFRRGVLGLAFLTILPGSTLPWTSLHQEMTFAMQISPGNSL